MPNRKMWFGSENRFQWVPQPASGMQASNVSEVQRMDLQRGRAAIFRSMQSHKEYSMDFPVQEASGLTGLDVFNKFATGFYGDNDNYPLFFADEMNFDQNLFPPAWAAPGLQRRGWLGICADGPVIWNNLFYNPSVEVDAAGWSDIDGTSGVSSGARTASTTAASGRYVYRVTWATGTSAVSGGGMYEDSPAFPAVDYYFQMAARPSVTQRLQMTITWRDSGGVSLGTDTSAAAVVSSNTWETFTIDSSTSPANTSTVDVQITAVVGASGTNWGVGNTLDLDAALMTVYNDVPSFYFDGDTARAVWNGDRGSSSSMLFVERTLPTFSDTPANSYELPPSQVTHDITSQPNAYPTPNNTYGAIPYCIIPIPPGYTLWYGYTGATTGSAQMVAEFYNAPGTAGSPDSTTVMTALTSSGATRMNHSGDGYDYAKFYIRRSDESASTITISSMMAQLWPTGTTPTVTGNFIDGRGHLGLKFGDDAIVETYVMYDPYRQTTAHLKGLSTTLVEAQDGD